MSLTANEALSGILGSISLTAWVFLLLPQLSENYTNGSGEGISILFLFIWALGDVLNLAGALWAGLVPTVIALAVYFCLSDSLLIIQCLYYRYRSQSGKSVDSDGYTSVVRQSITSQPREATVESDDEQQPLLDRQDSHCSYTSIGLPGSHIRKHSNSNSMAATNQDSHASYLRASLVNTACVLAVIAVGILAWFTCYKAGVWTPVPPPQDNKTDEDATPMGAEILGYASAALYLGARIPQIVKNFKLNSTEGLSLLFFLLSLLGNASYGAGILAHSVNKQYVVTNIPWLIGSLGTMVEDVVIFLQFRIYR